MILSLVKWTILAGKIFYNVPFDGMIRNIIFDWFSLHIFYALNLFFNLVRFVKEESPDKGLAPYQIYAQVKKPPKPNRKENDIKKETKQSTSGFEKEVSPVTEIKNDSNTKLLEKHGIKVCLFKP